MSVIINGSTITSFVFNGVSCSEVFFDGVKVFGSDSSNKGYTKGLFVYNAAVGSSDNGLIKIVGSMASVESSTTAASATKGSMGSASAGDLCLVFGGSGIVSPFTQSNSLDRFNISGSKVGSSSSGGHAISNPISASVGSDRSKALFFSGMKPKVPPPGVVLSTAAVVFNEDGTVLTTTSALSTATTGTGASSNASQNDLSVLFKYATTDSRLYTKVNESLSVTLNKTFVSSISEGNAGGCSLKDDTIWYGQFDAISGFLIKINSSDSMVGSGSHVGYSKYNYTGCNIGDNAVFAGGVNIYGLDYKSGLAFNTNLTTVAVNTTFNSNSANIISGGVN